MLTTEKLAQLKTEGEELTFTRPHGVFKQVRFPVDILERGVIKVGLEPVTEVLGVTGEEDSSYAEEIKTAPIEIKGVSDDYYGTLTDTIGIGVKSTYDIVFIDDNTIFISLISGELALKSGDGQAFCFNDKGMVLPKNTGFRWLSVKELYDIVAQRVKYVFHPDDMLVPQYIYNATVRMELSYVEHCASKQSHCGLNTTSYKVESLFATYTNGVFEYTVFEPKPERKYSVLKERTPEEMAEAEARAQAALAKREAEERAKKQAKGVVRRETVTTAKETKAKPTVQENALSLWQILSGGTASTDDDDDYDYDEYEDDEDIEEDDLELIGDSSDYEYYDAENAHADEGRDDMMAKTGLENLDDDDDINEGDF